MQPLEYRLMFSVYINCQVHPAFPHSMGRWKQRRTGKEYITHIYQVCVCVFTHLLYIACPQGWLSRESHVGQLVVEPPFGGFGKAAPQHGQIMADNAAMLLDRRPLPLFYSLGRQRTLMLLRFGLVAGWVEQCINCIHVVHVYRVSCYIRSVFFGGW